MTIPAVETRLYIADSYLKKCVQGGDMYLDSHTFCPWPSLVYLFSEPSWRLVAESGLSLEAGIEHDSDFSIEVKVCVKLRNR